MLIKSFKNRVYLPCVLLGDVFRSISTYRKFSADRNGTEKLVTVCVCHVNRKVFLSVLFRGKLNQFHGPPNGSVSYKKQWCLRNISYENNSMTPQSPVLDYGPPKSKAGSSPADYRSHFRRAKPLTPPIYLPTRKL